MIYKVQPQTGLEIIWASGNGLATAGGFTAADIDNEIAINGEVSIEETHRSIFNGWLESCNISTDEGGAAETTQKQAYIKRSFRLLCLYAYSKQGLLQSLQDGKCDCDCEAKQKQYLKVLSEDVICKSIGNSCLKQKYLDWLNGVCSEGFEDDFYSSEVVTNECRKKPRRYDAECDSCGS